MQCDRVTAEAMNAGRLICLPSCGTASTKAPLDANCSDCLPLTTKEKDRSKQMPEYGPNVY
jgi:hypothetical protein